MIAMRGSGGEVRTGCRVAARLRKWTIENEVLRSDDPEVDDYWADDPGPKQVRLPVGNSEWTWRDVAVASWRPLVVRVTGSPERR